MSEANIPEYPIPMFETAEAIVNSDDGIDPFISSLFPEADQHQITMMKLFLIGFALEHQEIGRMLERHGATDDLFRHQQQSQVSIPAHEHYASHNLEEHVFLMKGFCAFHQPQK